MNEEQRARETFKRLATDLPYFAETCLKIVDESGNVLPLIFNDSQLSLHRAIEKQLKEIGMVRMVVPKGRKQGVSTYTEARFFHKAFFNAYKKVSILTHHSKSTKELFSMVATFYTKLPDVMKQKLLVDNSDELGFANGSKYVVATAGEGEIGRGLTPHLFHLSEAASVPNPAEIKAGALSSVAMAKGTEMIIESTAKGPGDLFHEYCMMGLEDLGLWRTHFLPYHIHKAYSFDIPIEKQPLVLTEEERDLLDRFPHITHQQFYWRRMMIAEKGPDIFRREFPATIEEAFETSEGKFFNIKHIIKARQSKVVDKFAPLILSVDAARDGDRTVFCYRRGRQITKIHILKDMDEMRLVGLIANAINNEKVDKVFIDTASAYGAVDRLNELGYQRIIESVHFSSTPIDPSLYANKRAEMAFLLRDWLEGDVSIPDDNAIGLDLGCIPEAKSTSNSRWILEPKKEIKKRNGGKSTDIFDSMILSFAFPVANTLGRAGRNMLDSEEDLRYRGKQGPKQDFVSPVMESFSRNDKQPMRPTRNDGPRGHY